MTDIKVLLQPQLHTTTNLIFWWEDLRFSKKNPVLDAVQKMIGTVPQKVTGGGLESFQGVSVIINLIGINILVNSFNYQASQYLGREKTLFWISELKADYGQAWLAYCIVYWLFTNIF